MFLELYYITLFLQGKRTSELFRGMIVLPLCTMPLLRKKEQLLMGGLKKVFGEKLYAKLLKLTFFGQFVGGETIIEVSKSWRLFTSLSS